ncbi:hypothetical protein D3C86_1694630 [compost metagenome]
MALLHGLKSNLCPFGVASVHLQLRVTQGNGQLGLGLALQSTLQQAVALFVVAQFVCRTRRTKVVQ